VFVRDKNINEKEIEAIETQVKELLKDAKKASPKVGEDAYTVDDLVQV
jgi:hypothetical protein